MSHKMHDGIRTCVLPDGHEGAHRKHVHRSQVQKVPGRTPRENRWRQAGIIGMTVERYDEMLAEQGGRCAICHLGPTIKAPSLAVDHDHKITDRPNVRGLLCTRCNWGMSWIDSGEHLPTPKIVAYLEHFALLDAQECERLRARDIWTIRDKKSARVLAHKPDCPCEDCASCRPPEYRKPAVLAA